MDLPEGELAMTSITEGRDFPLPRSNPFNAPDFYAEARTLSGLPKVRLWNGAEAYLATRYEDVQTVFRDPAFSNSPLRDGYPFVAASLQGLLTGERPMFANMDGAEHLNQRRMLTRLFRVPRINQLRESLQKMVDDQLDLLMERGSQADFYEEFTLVVPSMAISVLLGVPYEDHEFFQEVARDRMDLTAGPERPIVAGQRLGAFLEEHFKKMLQMEDPGDHVMGTLVKEQIRPGNLSLEDAVSICRILLIAGHETTANAIAFSLVVLIENPAQLEALRADPSLMPSAIEELLRYTSVPQFSGTRVAMEDVYVGEQLVKAGEGILGLPLAANRDPSVFEEPDTLDLARTDNPHIAFADGAHQCLGQPLARLELDIALTTVLKRMPNLRLTVPVSELEFRFTERAYGVYHLPVAW